MMQFIIPFLTFTSILSAIIFGIGKLQWNRFQYDIDRQYFNEDGDHIYYDRSLIEKKIFKRQHPHIKNIRSFSRLLKNL